ncbi:FadR/GntR family transcriptional regulator [Caulobacter sp. LARHSG274]
MPSFAPLRAAQNSPLGRRAPHRLAYALMGRIKTGALRPGEWLPTERELRREFPVSRTVLREALIILECLGLIESHHGAGSQVIGREPKSRLGPVSVDIIALLEACRAFEIEAASLAAGLSEADGISPAPPRPGASGPMTVALCRDFHVALAQATGNPAIWASIRNLWDLAATRPAFCGPFNAALTRADRGLRLLQRRVVEAVATRSPAAARQAVDALFAGYLAAILDFEEREHPIAAPAKPPTIDGRRRMAPNR